MRRFYAKRKHARRRRRRERLSKQEEFREREETARRRARVAALLAEDIEDVLAAFRSGINLDDLEIAVVGGEMAVADRALGLGNLQANFAAVLRERLAEGVGEGAEIGLRFAPPSFATVPPELANEVAASWIADRAAAQAVGLTENTRKAVQRVLLDQLTDVVSPTEAAERIGRVAGLLPRQATALENFRRTLTDALAPEPLPGQPFRSERLTPQIRGVIDDRVEAMRQRFLRERGALIAETEMQEAIQRGERAFYEVASDSQEVDRSRLDKTWRTVLDSRVCPICMPLHGITIGFDDSFESRGFMGLHPPAHARCRCYIEHELREN